MLVIYDLSLLTAKNAKNAEKPEDDKIMGDKMMSSFSSLFCQTSFFPFRSLCSLRSFVAIHLVFLRSVVFIPLSLFVVALGSRLHCIINLLRSVNQKCRQSGVHAAQLLADLVLEFKQLVNGVFEVLLPVVAPRLKPKL